VEESFSSLEKNLVHEKKAAAEEKKAAPAQETS
jgi:hypothetical protein